MPKIEKVTPESSDSKAIIKDLYKMRGWTQAQLAQEVGYNNASAISWMLTGPRGLSIERYLKMLDVLGADLIVRDKMGSGKEWRIDDLLLRESINGGAKSGKAD